MRTGTLSHAVHDASVRSEPAKVEAGGEASDEQILAYLRRLFEDDCLAYRVSPKSITHGAETRILAFELQGESAPSTGLVLRIFRDPDATDRARREAVIQNALVGAGYPAARVIDVGAGDVLGRPFLLMARLDGTALLAQIGNPGGDGSFHIASAKAIVREGAMLPFVPRLLARAQQHLCAVDVGVLISALRASRIPEDSLTVDEHLRVIARTAEDLDLDDLSDLLIWLRDHRPLESRRVICHGDVQPLNVLACRSQITGVRQGALVAISSKIAKMMRARN